ncbi:DUF4345 domain-containing protein [Chelativorans sp. AA-79]|uniref:DUF4345 domain-containing protein n=1 Tax=Chelativorans sp. AA-79 TaxID=3028735 RepID=UPI0023F66B36|nr:DUF4345 domain-containing protein [Chelativorans sp. AA-79]WEX09957.1 DUF4345 domain-containing protein [Chelativorans sp. AA-79]
MDFAFPWPYSPGEWLAWIGAALTALFGLANLIAPRLILRAGAAADAGSTRALLGGFYAGTGLSAILFAQPLIYLALGIAWALAALGQALSLLFDKGSAVGKSARLAATLLMAALPLAFVLGFIP